MRMPCTRALSQWSKSDQPGAAGLGILGRTIMRAARLILDIFLRHASYWSFDRRCDIAPADRIVETSLRGGYVGHTSHSGKDVTDRQQAIVGDPHPAPCGISMQHSHGGEYSGRKEADSVCQHNAVAGPADFRATAIQSKTAMDRKRPPKPRKLSIRTCALPGRLPLVNDLGAIRAARPMAPFRVAAPGKAMGS